MNSGEIVRLCVKVEGRVQGVGFRYFVLEKALQLALSGWVRNISNGNVEVLAEGGRAELEKLLSSLRMGPPSSFVSNVSSSWHAASNEFSGFNIRSTL